MSDRSKGLEAISPSMERRFWAKVIKGDGCWDWSAAKSPGGYGKIGFDKTGKALLASRVSFVLHHRPLEPGELVLHTCDNPPCTKPDHLFAGSDKDNVRDMIDKGRANRGIFRRTAHPNKRFTEIELVQIRIRLAWGERHWVIADTYGVHRTTITAINRGKNWA